MAMTLRRPLLLLLLALALALCLAPTASETLTPDGLLSKLDKRDRVTLTTADGETKEITVAEMERLAKEQHRKQAEMQREATAAAAATAGGATVEYKEDEATAPKRKTERLDDISKRDPRFAANIALVQRSFAELQRHGYARGYVLAGFSEKDEAAAAARTQATARAIKERKAGRSDYDVTLLLRAKREAHDTAARTGTSATKRALEPLAVAYEVRVRVDAQDAFAVLAAWELDATDVRSTRLSVGTPDATPSPESQQMTQMTTTPQWSPTWFLAAGIALIGAGGVVLYTSQPPAPRVARRRNSAANWELVTDDKKTKAKTKRKPQQAVADAKKTD